MILIDISHFLWHTKVGESLPCGFCGLSGKASCSELFLVKGRGGSMHVESQCPYAHNYQYKQSKKSTVKTPCTNTPILCEIEGCTRRSGTGSPHLSAVWKLDMPEHIRLCHQGYSYDGDVPGARIPTTMWTEMQTTDEEEIQCGIPATHIPYKSFYRATPASAVLAPAHPEAMPAFPALPAALSSTNRSQRRTSKRSRQAIEETVGPDPAFVASSSQAVAGPSKRPRKSRT